MSTSAPFSREAAPSPVGEFLLLFAVIVIFGLLEAEALLRDSERLMTLMRGCLAIRTRRSVTVF
jgi:hypothetical protein